MNKKKKEIWWVADDTGLYLIGNKSEALKEVSRRRRKAKVELFQKLRDVNTSIYAVKK